MTTLEPNQPRKLGRRAVTSFNPELVARLNKLTESNANPDSQRSDFDKLVAGEIKALEPVPTRKRTPPRPYHRKAPILDTASSVITEPTPTVHNKTGKRTRFGAINRDRILQLGKSIGDPETRALYFTLYLTGARLSEVLGLTRGMIEAEERTEKRAPAVMFTVKTLKRRVNRNLQRTVSALRIPPYDEMIDEVERWINQFQNPDDVIFDLQRTNVNKRFRKIEFNANPIDTPEATLTKRLNPHYLRRCRLTHLVQYHRFTDSMLREFTQWTSANPATEYVSLDRETLAERQMVNT